MILRKTLGIEVVRVGRWIELAQVAYNVRLWY